MDRLSATWSRSNICFLSHHRISLRFMQKNLGTYLYVDLVRSSVNLHAACNTYSALGLGQSLAIWPSCPQL
eukprot:scaffold10050_cov142-Amphora_coffeaeformis.AAC.7